MSIPLGERIAVVTGAGRGIGRAHALTLARHGARVVVNDPGRGPDGAGMDSRPADTVVDEIIAMGGEATASYDDVSEPEGAEAIIASALDAFGGLDVLINNAGILRDRRLVNMSLVEWDDVVRVHLRGTFLMTQCAARYWRAEAKAERGRKASVVNTSSVSGLLGIEGQSNYGAAKAGVLTFSLVAAAELAPYGVRVNAVCPAARTRLSVGSSGTAHLLGGGDGEFDPFDPMNVAAFVAYLAAEGCPVTGEVFSIGAGKVGIHRGWTTAAEVDQATTLVPDDFEALVASLPLGQNRLFSP